MYTVFKILLYIGESILFTAIVYNFITDIKHKDHMEAFFDIWYGILCILFVIAISKI